MSAAHQPVHVTTQTFLAEVLETSDHTPVLVDFWAPWCGPCKQLEPVLQRIVDEYAGLVNVVKVNTDEEPQLATQLGIRSLPTVVLFKQRAIADHFVGVLPEGQIRELLEKHIVRPEPTQTPLEQARALKAAGLWEEARDVLQPAIAADPKSVELQAELGEVAALSGDLESARNTLEDLQAHDPTHRAVKRLEALLKFNDVVAAHPDSKTLDEQVKADPTNLDARHALAVHQLLEGEHEAAVTQWLEMMRKHRTFGDDLARKSLVMAFELLGEADPLVSKTRREMARLLF